MTIGLVGVFLAGLGTFLTPCVLPLIPVYLTSLVGGDARQLESSNRGQLMLRASLFSFGFILVFTVMGLGASSIGSFLSERRGLLMLVGAALVLVFGLKFLGFINIPFMDRVVKADDRRMKTRFAGINALLMGIVFAAGWSPCVGPVLGSVLTYTASTAADPLTGAFYLFVYGLGFALPLLTTAFFASSALKMLSTVNRHLPKIERGIGATLVVVALSLGYDAVDQLQVASAGPLVEQSVAAGDQSPTPRMIELYGDDCPICQKMKPVVDRIVSRCDQKGVRVQAIDVSQSENRHWVARYRIVGVPTFLFIDEKGAEVARLVGEQTEKTLYQGLSALRGEQCPGIGQVETFDDSRLRKRAENQTPLSFPKQSQEVVTCRSTSSTVSAAASSLKSSAKQGEQTEYDASAAGLPLESCEQELL